MTQWEYRVERLGAPLKEGDIQTGKLEELDESLRKKIENLTSAPEHDLTPFGADGWELVLTSPDAGSIVWIFRRQVR